MQTNNKSRCNSRIALQTKSVRRGVLTLEALIAVLLLTFVTCAALSYTLIALKLQALQAAAIAGVRQASLIDQLATQESAARSVMQPICEAHGIDLTSATITFTHPASPPNALSMQVQIGLNSAGVPDWLSCFGVSWSTRTFDVTALAFSD